MIVDTSALMAFFHTGEPQHEAVSALLTGAREPLVVSPCVLAELDYLVATRVGAQAEAQVLRALAGPAWTLAPVTAEQLDAATDLVEQYADFPVGLTDALNVVLADTHKTRRIATLDRRHFSVLRLADGAPVEIVPLTSRRGLAES
ncbi:MAG: PIN domain-containing protein [Bifidobacteriaceae bacterium]|jgi:predicted nucleic acid-binding protein|nr:PIN domain-containing protein [Bifidobacteriaceae bacterium]